MKKMIKSLVAGLMATGCLIAYGEPQTADEPEKYTETIRLKYADAEDVARMCNDIVNTNLVRFRPDKRCNTIIVTAPKTDLATIKRVIDEMDMRLSPTCSSWQQSSQESSCSCCSKARPAQRGSSRTLRRRAA